MTWYYFSTHKHAHLRGVKMSQTINQSGAETHPQPPPPSHPYHHLYVNNHVWNTCNYKDKWFSPTGDRTTACAYILLWLSYQSRWINLHAKECLTVPAPAFLSTSDRAIEVKLLASSFHRCTHIVTTAAGVSTLTQSHGLPGNIRPLQRLASGRAGGIVEDINSIWVRQLASIYCPR